VNKEIRGKDWFDYAAFPQASSIRPSCAVSKAIATWRAASAAERREAAVECRSPGRLTADGAVMEGELTVKREGIRIGTGEVGRRPMSSAPM